MLENAKIRQDMEKPDEDSSTPIEIKVTSSRRNRRSISIGSNKIDEPKL